MADPTRPTLRLRMPPASAPAVPGAPAERPAAPRAYAPPAGGTGPRPAAGGGGYAGGPRTIVMTPRAPVPLDSCSHAILEELAALGLADTPEG